MSKVDELEARMAELERRLAELAPKPESPRASIDRAPFDHTANWKFTPEQLGLDRNLAPDLSARDPSLPNSPASPVERGTGWIEPRKLDHALDSFAGRMTDADLARRK